MKFTIEIDSDNAALVDDPINELSTICRKAVMRIDNGATEGKLLDSNGNAVGSFTYEASEDEADDIPGLADPLPDPPMGTPRPEPVEALEENEDQDEAENIAQNFEHLYLSSFASQLEARFRDYLIEYPSIDNPDPDNVDFDALFDFLQK